MNRIYLHLALVAALLGIAAGASDRNPEQFTPNQANWKTFESKPFADSRNPTRAEVDEWHRIAINHVRALVGYTGADREVKKDHCMFKRALRCHLPARCERPVALPAGRPCDVQSAAGCRGSFQRIEIEHTLVDQMVALAVRQVDRQADAESVQEAVKFGIFCRSRTFALHSVYG